MITINNVGKWILPAYRKHINNYDTRVNVFYGGAGSGKSYFVVQKLIIKALRSVRRVLVVRKVGRTLKNSIWALFLELLTKYMPQVILDVNKSDLTITLINGSQFIFTGLDDSEKIKSIQGITDIIIEEATEITADDFTQLNLRLRSPLPNNQIHMMFNPVSKTNWVYKYFFGDNPPEDCTIQRTTYKDNHYLNAEYIKTLEDMKNRNPAYYRIYALGEFATLDKLVFPKYETRIISEDEYTKGGYKTGLFWCGMDFGYTNDPTALNWGYWKPQENKLLILGEYDRKGMTNDKIAEVIQSLGMSKERIIADSAEPKSIDEIKRMGVRRLKGADKGPDSVKNGIDRLQRCDIIIDERCPHTVEEFDNYTWQKDKKTGEYTNTPIDTYNHHIDAIRYGTQDVMKKNRTEEEIIEMERLNADLSGLT